MSELINQWRDLSTQNAIPMQASLELTHRCNESCEHCYLDELRDDHSRLLSLEEWYKVLSELKSGGVLYLIFIGGEAMLSPHFWPLSLRAHQNGFDLSLITNGLKIRNLDIAKRLKQNGFRHITFSLYSLDPAIHDELTNTQGSHLRTIKAIELCREAGLEVGINCLLTYKNIDQYYNLAQWCVDRGLEIKADPNITPKFSGDLTPVKLRASKQQLSQYFIEGLKRWPRSIAPTQPLHPQDYVCNAAKGKCAVTPYGDLLSCLEIRESLGNLKHLSFHQAWHSPQAQKWRNIRNHDLDSPMNNHCDHCPGMADHEHGLAHKLTPFTKELALLKSQAYEYVQRN